MQHILQNATELCFKMSQVFYYKMRQCYYKMQQLSQNETILLQNATFIRKCGVHYKLPQYMAFINRRNWKKVFLNLIILVEAAARSVL